MPDLSLTRRLLLTGGGATVLAACGSSSDPAAPADGAPSPSPATDPLSLRVVTLDPFSTQDVLDLGLTPVGVQEGLETVILPEYVETYRALPTVGTFSEPDLEQIAGLAPDLILASTGQAQVAPRLERIARTVLVEGTTSTTWPQAAGQVAAALGLEDRLEALVETYDARAAEIAQTHASVLDRSVWALVWRGEDAGLFVRPPDSNCGQVLAKAGARFCATMRSITDGQDVLLSWENVRDLDDADVLGVPSLSDGSPDPQTEVILDQPLVGRLGAVRAGRLVTFSHFTPGSYRNATALLDEFDAALADLA